MGAQKVVKGVGISKQDFLNLEPIRSDADLGFMRAWGRRSKDVKLVSKRRIGCIE